MLFHYEAMDNTGLEVKDVIEADSKEEATARVRQKGFFVTKIRENTYNDQVKALRRASIVSTVVRKDVFSPDVMCWGFIMFIFGVIVGALLF